VGSTGQTPVVPLGDARRSLRDGAVAQLFYSSGISAVYLRIPDLPDPAARDRLEAEDILIKSINRHSAPHALNEAAPLNSGDAADGNESFQPDPADGFRKASPDDPKHPGWPAGTEGGRGGQFRPKDASELTQKVKSLIARRALRTGLVDALDRDFGNNTDRAQMNRASGLLARWPLQSQHQTRRSRVCPAHQSNR
jgi:hypothetical protein